MKKVMDKGISAAGTLLFVGAIQTEAPAWTLVILALVIYEVAQWCCRISRKEAGKNRKKHYITVTKRDAQRWANTKIGWPMKEVS